jgi:hypothetical protein
MDVDRLQSSRADILETVRNTCWSQNGFSRASLYDVFSDEEPRPAGDDDEGFVIWMDMQSRTFPWRVVAICKNRHRSADDISRKRAAPWPGRLRVENNPLGRGSAIRLHGLRIKISSRHRSPPIVVVLDKMSAARASANRKAAVARLFPRMSLQRGMTGPIAVGRFAD